MQQPNWAVGAFFVALLSQDPLDATVERERETQLGKRLVSLVAEAKSIDSSQQEVPPNDCHALTWMFDFLVLASRGCRFFSQISRLPWKTSEGRAVSQVPGNEFHFWGP